MAVVEGLDVVEILWPLTFVHLLVYLDGALVLQAALHQQLLFLPLGLERHARNLAVKRDGEKRRPPQQKKAEEGRGGGGGERRARGGDSPRPTTYLWKRALSHWDLRPAERIVRASIGCLPALPN